MLLEAHLAKNKGQNRFKIKFNGHRNRNAELINLGANMRLLQDMPCINPSRTTGQRHLALEVSPNHKNCRSCGITKECTCHRRQPNCRLFTLRHLKFDKTDRSDRNGGDHHMAADLGEPVPEQPAPVARGGRRRSFDQRFAGPLS